MTGGSAGMTGRGKIEVLGEKFTAV